MNDIERRNHESIRDQSDCAIRFYWTARGARNDMRLKLYSEMLHAQNSDGLILSVAVVALQSFDMPSLDMQ